MSTITFKCGPERKDEVKTGIWEIIHDHYITTAFPNTNVDYEYEGEEVYADRLDKSMKNGLCKIKETSEGVQVEFDSTENAGFTIASEVYKTGNSYCDMGLPCLEGFFKRIVETFPDICFEADCECSDGCVFEEYHCTYDGKTLESDAEWDDEDFDF